MRKVTKKVEREIERLKKAYAKKQQRECVPVVSSIPVKSTDWSSSIPYFSGGWNGTKKMHPNGIKFSPKPGYPTFSAAQRKAVNNIDKGEDNSL